MLNPDTGDVIPGTGGLRKLRFADERRGKGKRGGLRVIYYWWHTGSQMSDLTASERKALKEMIKQELEARRADEEGNQD